MKDSQQELFLNALRKQKTSVTIFLTNGIKLSGKISGFDNFSIILKRDNHMQIVYKHAVSTILPAEPFEINLTKQDSATDN